MAKQKANFVKCEEDEGLHSWKDNCWGCAPFWYIIPTCPSHKIKLSSKGYCKDCKRFYDIQD